jgi:hypothetical protein
MRIVRDGELAVGGDSPCSIRADTAAAVIPGWLAVRETPRSRIGHIAIGILVLENIDAVLRRRPAPFLVTSHEYHQARLAHNDSHRHSNVSLLEKARGCGVERMWLNRSKRSILLERQITFSPHSYT